MKLKDITMEKCGVIAAVAGMGVCITGLAFGIEFLPAVGIITSVLGCGAGMIGLDASNYR